MGAGADRPGDPVVREPGADPLGSAAGGEERRDPLRVLDVVVDDRVAVDEPLAFGTAGARAERPRVEVRPVRAAVRRVRAARVAGGRGASVVEEGDDRVPLGPDLDLGLGHLREGALAGGGDGVGVGAAVVVGARTTGGPAPRRWLACQARASCTGRRPRGCRPPAGSSVSRRRSGRWSRTGWTRSCLRSHPSRSRLSARWRETRTRQARASAHGVACAQENLPYPRFLRPHFRKPGLVLQLWPSFFNLQHRCRTPPGSLAQVLLSVRREGASFRDDVRYSIYEGEGTDEEAPHSYRSVDDGPGRRDSRSDVNRQCCCGSGAGRAVRRERRQGERHPGFT